MTAAVCPHCATPYTVAGEPPGAWCRRCGGDPTFRPLGTNEREELVPLTAAEPAPRQPGSRWGKQPAAVRPTMTALTPPAVADTPAPAAGRWANRNKPRLVRTTAPWSAADDQRVEELAAQEMAARDVPLQPPAFECYLFVVACALLPVFTLGGGLWFAVGFGGASSCAKIAHSHSLPRPVKFVFCLGITAGAWGLFVLLLMAVVGMAQPARR